MNPVPGEQSRGQDKVAIRPSGLLSRVPHGSFGNGWRLVSLFLIRAVCCVLVAKSQ